MNPLQRALLWRDLATLGLFLAVVALTIYVLLALSDTNAALCKFRGDLEQRVSATQTYLDTHPGPEPFPGISRTSLKQSLANQRRTIDSLSNLNC